MNRNVVFIFLLLFNLIGVKQLVHAEEAEAIQIVTEHLPPLQSFQNGELTGASVTAVKQLLHRLGREEKIQVLPWARAYKKALTEPNVLIFTIRRTASREKQFHWVGALQKQKPTFFWTLKQQNLKIESWSQAINFKTALPRADSRVEQLLKKGFVINQNLFITNRFNEALQMFVKGRVDFYVGAELATEYQLTQLGYSLGEFHKTLESSTIAAPLYIAFSKQTSQSLVDQFRIAFEKLQTGDAVNKY